jgi:hypothetical protein
MLRREMDPGRSQSADDSGVDATCLSQMGSGKQATMGVVDLAASGVKMRFTVGVCEGLMKRISGNRRTAKT